jgi:hypothetical protein
VLPAAPAHLRIGRGDVQSRRAHHQPVQADEGQPLGLDDAGIFLARRGRDFRRFLGQRERRDFNARVADFADGPAGVGEGPFLEGFVADGVAERQFTSLLCTSGRRPTRLRAGRPMFWNKCAGRRAIVDRKAACGADFRERRLNEAAKRRTLARDTIWQGNCDATNYPLRSNAASFRNTKSIEYPLSNCPAKSGRLPSNVSIRSDPAI